MNVTLCSIFRNAESYLDRYFGQVEKLRDAIEKQGDTLTCLWGEGDSTDATLDRLMFDNDIAATIINVTHGGPEIGSIVSVQRFKQLAYACNLVWSQIPDDSDVVIWCESDLIWDAQTLLELIKDLTFHDCVAPLIMHASNPGLYQGNGDFFYDTYAYIRNGVHFTNESPYYPTLPHHGMTEMDSVGSCVAMDAEIARQVKFSPDNVIVGLCAEIRALGKTVWLDSSLTVFHK